MIKQYDTCKHCVFHHRYHIVWSTKYRHKVLTGPLRLRMRDICRHVCRENGVDILRGVLSSDHVHIFVSVPPKLAISDLVRKMKGRSSHRVQREFPELRRRYRGCRFWGREYFSTTNGAITAAFPDTLVQACIVHLVRHSLSFCSWKDRRAMAADLRRIYSAPTADMAAAELDAFEEKWAGKYASIAPAWRRAWAEVIPFFAFDPAIRKIIYTTNAIESLNRARHWARTNGAFNGSLRKSIKTRGSFPTDKAATKLIYLAIRKFEKDGRNVREWFAARNQFAIMFGERFDA